VPVCWSRVFSGFWISSRVFAASVFSKKAFAGAQELTDLTLGWFENAKCAYDFDVLYAEVYEGLTGSKRWMETLGFEDTGKRYSEPYGTGDRLGDVVCMAKWYVGN